MHRELGVEPLDGREREHLEEPDVRGLVASAVDAERHAVELPGDVLCRADDRSALVVGEEVWVGRDELVAMRPAKSPCVADSWRMGRRCAERKARSAH